MTHANTEVLRDRTPGPEHDGSQHELGALGFVALALALLAIAGLASSVSPWHANGAAVSAPTTALHGLASVGGVVLVVALLLLWVGTPTVRRRKKKKRPLSGDDLDELGTSLSTSAKTVAIVLLAVAIFCIAALPLLTRPSTPSQDLMRPGPPRPSGPARTSDRHTGADPRDLAWLFLPIAVTFAILTPVAVLVRRRRLKADEEGLEEPGALGAVRASIVALESEGDPRRAILLAYAQMEQAFRDVEIVRARDETASEFLGRAERQLPVSAGDAAVLTGRFEEARFSTHRLTEADRAQALAALRRVEWELTRRP